jgi:hydrogenase expression/formation protein HypD
MKYINEYRASEIINRYIARINHTIKGRWNIMEVCGGQTHAIYKFGIDQLLSQNITLLHGPGCPVCVTPASIIDKAISIALKPNTILCTFGDMIRVPGNNGDLLSSRGNGAKIQIVYSPIDAVNLAEKHPNKNIVFLAIGFETTAPLIASTILIADRRKINNYSILNATVRIPPAIEALLANPTSRIDALLAPGHVCTITGLHEYELLADKYQIPIIATGFEPVDLINGICNAVERLERGEAGLGNSYPRAVNYYGNKNARDIINQVFDIVDRQWRGLGIIKSSGYALKDKYKNYDVENRFDIDLNDPTVDSRCIVSDILSGRAHPNQCPEFGTNCRPEHPLGPMMVSAEGTCAAYYRYGRDYARK